MTTIKTEEFILRPLNLSDAEGYFEVMQDEDTKRNMDSVPNTLEETETEIREFLKQVEEKDADCFTIEVQGQYAGNIILQHQNHDPENNEGRFHVWIHPNFRGKGIATKALNEVINYGFKTKFTKIYSQCKSANKGVCRINEKLGFKQVHVRTNENGVEKTLWVKERS